MTSHAASARRPLCAIIVARGEALDLTDEERVGVALELVASQGRDAYYQAT
jgi:hypothetical protein